MSRYERENPESTYLYGTRTKPWTAADYAKPKPYRPEHNPLGIGECMRCGAMLETRSHLVGMDRYSYEFCPACEWQTMPEWEGDNRP